MIILVLRLLFNVTRDPLPIGYYCTKGIVILHHRLRTNTALGFSVKIGQKLILLFLIEVIILLSFVEHNPLPSCIILWHLDNHNYHIFNCIIEADVAMKTEFTWISTSLFFNVAFQCRCKQLCHTSARFCTETSLLQVLASFPKIGMQVLASLPKKAGFRYYNLY